MGRASRLKRERRAREAARVKIIPRPDELAKMTIRHKRSGARYEVISCWLDRPPHCGAKRVLDVIEVVEPPSPRRPIEMFVTDPDKWDWS